MQALTGRANALVTRRSPNPLVVCNTERAVLHDREAGAWSALLAWRNLLHASAGPRDSSSVRADLRRGTLNIAYRNGRAFSITSGECVDFILRAALVIR